MSQAVREMFGSIATRYDVANSVLSLGTHRGWRRKAMRLLAPASGQRILDVCCGTGDLAFALERRVAPLGVVHGTDFCPPMLTQAVRKAAPRNQTARTCFVAADALALPYPDDSFDAATVAFGIRNVDDPVAGLREMARVVRPDGRVMVLEFGQPSLPGFAGLYRWYSRAVMPRVGGWLTGDRAAYEYLPRTAARFPHGEAFLDLMRQAGLQGVQACPLSLGIAFVYLGIVHAGASATRPSHEDLHPVENPRNLP